MRNISAHNAKARFGQLLDATLSGPVTISKHGRAVAVVMSKVEYDALDAIKLENLRVEVEKGIKAIERGDFVTIERGNIQQFGDSIKAAGRKR